MKKQTCILSLVLSPLALSWPLSLDRARDHDHSPSPCPSLRELSLLAFQSFLQEAPEGWHQFGLLWLFKAQLFYNCYRSFWQILPLSKRFLIFLAFFPIFAGLAILAILTIFNYFNSFSSISIHFQPFSSVFNHFYHFWLFLPKKISFLACPRGFFQPIEFGSVSYIKS